MSLVVLVLVHEKLVGAIMFSMKKINTKGQHIHTSNYYYNHISSNKVKKEPRYMVPCSNVQLIQTKYH